MSTMVWDEAGARYYETGVSKGILWTPEVLAAGGVGVPWNGLVAVNLDPQGGEAESYWFDGVKYMNRILAEDFQATIQAISTPKEFRACEGDREFAPGVMTSFNKRDKFHMAWRTEIGSDAGEAVGHKWHIAYNNLVQPSGRSYQTISDTTAMDTRSFIVTATPACYRQSYFWFDSRDYDLSDLEAMLLSGVMPMCYELKDLVTPLDGAPPLADDDCPTILETFEEYNPGQVVSDDLVSEDGTQETQIFGLINNGLDITDLPAEGAFAANDSAASEVGTGSLTDDDDATYITSADGDLGYTVGLPPLVGYVEGAAFELHIRMSISGGVNSNNPDDLDADAQVHISTDADGDDTIGGFSDGTDEGVGFALSAVDGAIVDYVVPLNMDAWVDSTLEDVVTALEAGAYLNVVGVSNNNADTTPEVNVYEAHVVMFDTTDQNKALRTSDPDGQSYVELDIYAPGDSWPDTLTASCRSELDFLLKERNANVDYSGYVQDLFNSPHTTRYNLMATFSSDDADPEVQWFDGSISGSVPIASFTPEYNVEYHATFDNGWDAAHLKIVRTDTGAVVLEHDHATTLDPTAYMQFYTGYVGNSDGSKVYELTVDNTKLQVHCHDAPPASGSASLLHPGTIGWDLPTGLFDTGVVNGSLPLQDGSDSTYIGIETDGDGAAVTYINRATAPVYETYIDTPSALTVRVRAGVTSNDPAGGARLSLVLQDGTDGSPAVVLAPGTSDWVLPDNGDTAEDFEFVMSDAYFTSQGTSLAAIAAVLNAGNGEFVIQSNVTTSGASVHTFLHIYHVELEFS